MLLRLPGASAPGVEPNRTGGGRMAKTYTCNLERDGEQRAFKGHGHAALGTAGAVSFVKGTFEPGWRWSKDVKPIAGTDACLVHHLGYTISGRMRVTNVDGTETEIGPGDAFDIAPGHDAYVVGDEPCVMVDCSPDATHYASKMKAGTEDPKIGIVRKGYAAFNAADISTLVSMMSHDVIQHVPGTSKLAGDYKGIDAVLSYYAKLSEVSGGTFRAHLIDVHSDGHGHVVATHQTSATRNGVTRVSRGSLLFTFLGEKVTDVLQLHGDLEGDDAFLT
jgi:ketosteroid isomerase-like protein